MQHNHYGQPIGRPLPGWNGATCPVPVILEGRFCRLVPLDAAAHATPLFKAHDSVEDDRYWTYLPYDKPDSVAGMQAHLEQINRFDNFVNFVVIEKVTENPVGSVALMRIDAPSGVIEIGHVNWSVHMQRKGSSTEAVMLLLMHVFDELGFRRCEWKLDALNAPSFAAAERFGFRYEGTFRDALVYKGRSRDTAWLAITRDDWPAIRQGFNAWLDPGNFDESGRQRRRLADCMPPAS